ncbi:MAG: hypothetical protein Q4E01_01075 [Actinomycetaceae bacterium]|nr:hypothetical protein [Actinomycetaceae bacterium]
MATNNRPEGWIHDWDSSKSSSGQSGRIYDAHQGADGSFSIDEAPEQPVRVERLKQNLTTVPGRLLIRLASLSAGVTTLLGIIGASSFGSWGYWIPIILGVLGLAVTGFFAFRRKQLQDAIRVSGRKNVIGEQTAVARRGEQGDRQSELHDLAAREGEKVRRARAEFENRTARFFPRIEALQRAMKQMISPSYDAAWLEIDIRPTLAAFIGTVLVIPIGGFLIVMTAFALLLSAM